MEQNFLNDLINEGLRERARQARNAILDEVISVVKVIAEKYSTPEDIEKVLVLELTNMKYSKENAYYSYSRGITR